MLTCKIQAKRMEKGISQKQLSNITEIRLPTISDMETNKNKSLSIDNINKLCKYFNCDIGDLWEYHPIYR